MALMPWASSVRATSRTGVSAVVETTSVVITSDACMLGLLARQIARAAAAAAHRCGLGVRARAAGAGAVQHGCRATDSLATWPAPPLIQVKIGGSSPPQTGLSTGSTRAKARTLGGSNPKPTQTEPCRVLRRPSGANRDDIAFSFIGGRAAPAN